MIKRRQAPHVMHLNKYFCIGQWCHGETFFFICMWRLNRVQILLFFSIDLITGFIVWLSDSHVLISVLFLYYVRCVCVYLYIYDSFSCWMVCYDFLLYCYLSSVFFVLFVFPVFFLLFSLRHLLFLSSLLSFFPFSPFLILFHFLHLLFTRLPRSRFAPLQ